MEKKIYEIKGFDCPNCAAKVEAYLTKKEELEYVHLDYSLNKLYITYKNSAWSIEKLKEVIKEVESDELEINDLTKNKKEIKKVFNISGFDCPNCAAKAEAHIASKENVAFAHLDFSGNKLYITFKNNAWSVDELREIIKEVETDPLNISENNNTKKQESGKIFTPRMWVLVGRIIFSIIVTLICTFFLGYESLNWVRFGLYIFTICLIGYDIFYKVIIHIRNRNNILDHNMLISIAALGSLALSIIGLINNETMIHNGIAMDETMEAVMVIVLFQIGSIIEQVATNKSKSAIMSAVELRVDTANLITNDGVKVVKPESLKVDDVIIITAGELIPVDGTVIDGDGFIDTSSLTGEYVPTKALEGSEVFSGCLLKSGTLKVKVKKIYADSTVSKIIELIENGGEKKSKADEFIAKFAKIYTPIVVSLAILTILIGGLISQNYMEWVHTGLEILVIGCPCAIVVSVPLAYFSGVGLASRNGIVVKGANYLDELCNMGKIITDKTGTLTHGTFTIQEVSAINGNNDKLLEYVLAAECLSKHPIGKAICHDSDVRNLSKEIKDFEEVAGLGTKVTYKKHHIIAGGNKMMKAYGVIYNPVAKAGTIVYVAVDNEYLGYIVLADTVKKDAQPMVNLLHSEEVEIILLTGDHEDNAKSICNELGIDRWHSELLPEEKSRILESEMDGYKKSVAFIGDGINDAPSIIRSDIGIAMGGIGSDIAVENADIVIMNDDPAKVYDAMKIAKMARNTSLFNIIFALTIKILVFISALILPILGINDNFMMYVAVLADTGLTVLLVINSLLLLSRKVKRKNLI